VPSHFNWTLLFVIFGRLLMRAFYTLLQSPEHHEVVLNVWYPKIRTLCKFLVTSIHVRWARPNLSSKQSLHCRQYFLQRNHNTCSEFCTPVAIFHYCDVAHVRLLRQPTKHSLKIPVTTKQREEISLECCKTNSIRLGQSYLYSLVTERCWFICTASQHNTRNKPLSTMQCSTTYNLRNTHRTSPRTIYSMRRLWDNPRFWRLLFPELCYLAKRAEEQTAMGTAVKDALNSRGLAHSRDNLNFWYHLKYPDSETSFEVLNTGLFR
jgi:hypothetical protein